MRRPIWWERYQKLLAQDHEILKFRTFHVLDKQGTEDENGKRPIISSVQAVTKVLNDEKSVFRVQFSYTNPKDNNVKTYDRHFGRHYALERLNSDIALEITIDKDERVVDKLRECIVAEAARKSILWLKDVEISDIV